jgi:hypothetical protein
VETWRETEDGPRLPMMLMLIIKNSVLLWKFFCLTTNLVLGSWNSLILQTYKNNQHHYENRGTYLWRQDLGLRKKNWCSSMLFFQSALGVSSVHLIHPRKPQRHTKNLTTPHTSQVIHCSYMFFNLDCKLFQHQNNNALLQS